MNNKEFKDLVLNLNDGIETKTIYQLEWTLEEIFFSLHYNNILKQLDNFPNKREKLDFLHSEWKLASMSSTSTSIGHNLSNHIKIKVIPTIIENLVEKENDNK